MNATALPASPATFKAQVVATANRVRQDLTGDFAEIQALVDANQLVLAVWQDAVEPDGVGTMVIKGQQHLRGIVGSGRSAETTWTAIPCTCIEQAEALRQVAGERDGRH